MTARRTDMHRLQEMVRLHRMGQSGRAIARQLRVGRNTVACYLEVFAKACMLEGPESELPEVNALRRAVEEQLPAGKSPRQTSSVESWRGEIERLRKKGAGPTAIHDWLRVNKPEYTGSVSAVKRMYRRLELAAGPKATDVAIPVETQPGEVAQVDFGYAGKRYDPAQGVLRKCWLFVMTLCFSRRVFCDLVFDQKIETWVELHIQAFEFFGGVPRVIVPDNLKAAVIRAAFGVDDELMLNRTYRELARHYGFQIDPTPVRSPEKKGKVERDVQYVKGNFLATWDSVDIDADRLALRRWVAEIADKRRHSTTGRVPAELFEEDERDALVPLPEKCWEKVVWKKARLHRDSHVQIDASFYSAPWRYLHRDLWVRCTPFVVAIHQHLLDSARRREWLRLAELESSFFQAVTSQSSNRPAPLLRPGTLRAAMCFEVAPLARAGGGFDQPSLDNLGDGLRLFSSGGVRPGLKGCRSFASHRSKRASYSRIPFGVP